MKYIVKLNGKDVELEQDDSKIAVRFRKEHRRSARATVVFSHSNSLNNFSQRIEIPNEEYTILSVMPDAEYNTTVDALANDDAVVKVNPVFRINDKTIIPTDRILVRLSEEVEAAVCLSLHGEYEPLSNETTSEYILQLHEGEDPLKKAKELSQIPGILYAEPDFVTMGRHLARDPKVVKRADLSTDPLLNKQYAPTITRAVDAWKLQKGDRSVKIAILDEGVDTKHEDLNLNMLPGYDGTDDDGFQEPNAWDGHGTACAGLAAAIHDNRVGIKGIGGGCSIIPVRIAYSKQAGADWFTSNSWIARSIDWAWKNGASVISNSWGGGASSSAVEQAFKRAQTLGRDGKGCVVIIAAGNESGPVSFPGTVRDVLTVSASNEFDEFKTKTSRDGEDWWGSNFGPEVDIAAPGVHNLTTDISGLAGYTNNSYTDFNGTSSATPIVAGAAGLVLSANQNLTGRQVQEILTSTADKVGRSPYIDGRNNQFGYGRLNVYAAILAATRQLTVAPTLFGFHTISHLMEMHLKIKDNQTSSVSLVVGEDGLIADGTVLVDIDHTDVRDLEVTLIPPVGAPVKLHARQNTPLKAKEYKFSELATLNGFLGTRSRGTWRLDVKDTANRDEGEVLQFGMKFGYNG